MKRTNMAAAVVLSVLLASGCATKTGEKSDPEVGSNASSSEAQPAEEASDEAPEDSTLTFGETYKYEDGVSIRVGKPKPFKPSEYAAADEAPAYLSFEVVIVNGGAEPFDPSVSTASLQSGDIERTPRVLADAPACRSCDVSGIEVGPAGWPAPLRRALAA
ncbi:hypothetical protein [Aeromicrobium sp. 179-A 4D2 NHS]|uniref:hypothetical protein n=1 Tax=Aeromicrobium sp. 179-A 4D2 NHS TaxID=3142375 RepID=UPI0039A1F21D